eukprot:scaffold39574_cov216-Skeletonema_dohrnii-CCMP3373.AAC.7
MARYLFILALIATGASAFYKGAVPQQEGPKIPAAAAGLLDNPAVASDPNINPARKCGFCMGVCTRCEVWKYSEGSYVSAGGGFYWEKYSFEVRVHAKSRLA